MVCHIMACMWIFSAGMSVDTVLDENKEKVLAGEENWITEKAYQNMTQSELYCTAFYFTVTTITTVGYGDISGFNVVEKIMCVFLMLAGTFFFAFASGTLTAMISNYDS